MAAPVDMIGQRPLYLIALVILVFKYKDAWLIAWYVSKAHCRLSTEIEALTYTLGLCVKRHEAFYPRRGAGGQGY
jgi:hypothetical protein